MKAEAKPKFLLALVTQNVRDYRHWKPFQATPILEQPPANVAEMQCSEEKQFQPFSSHCSIETQKHLI